MICAYCKSDIDDDSFYCDQCSKELFVCSTCGKPGKGKNCVEDGSKLLSSKQKHLSVTPNELQNENSNTIISKPKSSIFNQPSSNPLKVQQPLSTNNQSIPVLKLINNNLKIDIDLKDGEIIGRTEGEHENIFSQFSQISGKHLQFNFDKNNGWTIKDLGSTNGTAISGAPNWQNVPKLNHGLSITLNNNSFLLIANIEFQVKIIPPQSSTPTGTQRL